MTCDGAGALALRRWRSGLHAEGEHDERELGIMLSGHLFPLLLDAVQVGSKRRAENSLGLGMLDVNALEIRRAPTMTNTRKRKPAKLTILPDYYP